MSDYPVGYRKPPAQNRFRKGQSGNPRGRPKGAKGLSASLQKIFDKSVTIKEAGIPKKIPIVEAVGMRLVEKALQGDPRAIKEFIGLHQKYDEINQKTIDNNVVITYTWASPFDPENEDLSTFLNDDEIEFLKYIIGKREKVRHPDQGPDPRPPFLLVQPEGPIDRSYDMGYSLENDDAFSRLSEEKTGSYR